MNLPEYNEEENSANNEKIKENFIQKLSEECGKDFRYVKNGVISEFIFFGNLMIGLNNIIYFCEILGIRNLYIKYKYDCYIKNDIITDKLHISVKPVDNLNCFSQDTFCVNLYVIFIFLHS